MDEAEKLNAVDPEFFTYKTRDINQARKVFALDESRRKEDFSAGVGKRIAHQKTLAREEAKRGRVRA